MSIPIVPKIITTAFLEQPLAWCSENVLMFILACFLAVLWSLLSSFLPVFVLTPQVVAQLLKSQARSFWKTRPELKMCKSQKCLKGYRDMNFFFHNKFKFGQHVHVHSVYKVPLRIHALEPQINPCYGYLEQQENPC